MMKKLLVIAFAAFAAIALAACSFLPVVDTFQSQEDVVGFEAVAAAELLANSLSETLVANPLGLELLDEDIVTTAPDTTDETIVDDELGELDRYLAMIEQFLGNENGLSVAVASSDLPEYTYKMTYTTKSLFGEDVVYVLYYNEVLYVDPDDTTDVVTTDDTVTTAPSNDETTTSAPETTVPETTVPETTVPDTVEPDITDPDTTAGASTTTDLSYATRQSEQDRLRDRDFMFADDGDDAIVYAVSGMLVVGDTSFQLEGKRSITDGEEVMLLRAFIDHENFVKVRSIVEDGAKQFAFEVVTGGVIQNAAKVKVSVENDEVKVRLAFVDGAANGTYDFKFETVDAVTTIKVTYAVEDADGVEETGSIRIVATYDETTALTTYTYEILPATCGNHPYGGSTQQYSIDRDDDRGHGSVRQGGDQDHGGRPDDGQGGNANGSGGSRGNDGDSRHCAA